MVNVVELIDSGKSSDLLELVSSVSNAKQRRRRPRTRKRDPQHVPRPTNCFMIYRLEMQRYIRTYCPNANHREISKIVAKWWHGEPSHIKEQFRTMADKAKQEHKDMYPEYKYVPKKKKKAHQSMNSKDQKPQKPVTEPGVSCTSPPSATGYDVVLREGLAPTCAVEAALSTCSISRQQQQQDNEPDCLLYADPPTSLFHPPSNHHHYHHSLLPATDDAISTTPMVFYGASSTTSPLATPVWDTLSYPDPIISYGSFLDHPNQPYYWQRQQQQQQLILPTESAAPSTTALTTTPVPPPPSLVEALSYSYSYYPTYY